MKKEELDILIGQLLAGELTAEAQARLKEFIMIDNNRQVFVDSLAELTSGNEEEIPFNEEVWLPIIGQVVKVDAPPVKKIHFLRTSWVRYAAAIVLMAGCAVAYLYFSPKSGSTKITDQPASRNIAIPPGSNGAVLTLADGTTMQLDSAGNGVVAMQEGAQVVQQNGQLVYHSTEKPTGKAQYNAMRTPKGRQYHLTLPDGTEVWLNAGSSIRYPTAFTGKERNVEMTGEAYFEVAKNPQMPFKVSVNNKATIEVLGTHFNVNAYENEETLNTTLLEGSVQIHAGKKASILKPGQQAQVADGINVKDDADLDKVMAWKNGLFDFDNVSLKQAMREIERWYNIEVVYENEIPEITFGGKLPKNISLNDLLSVLEESNVHFRLDGSKLIVSK